MKPKNHLSKLTYQEVTANERGANEVLFKIIDIIDETETAYIIKSKKEEYLVYKDSMFAWNKEEYKRKEGAVLNELSGIVSCDAVNFTFSRIVLGNQTDISAKESFIRAVNSELKSYYYEEYTDGFYLDVSGQLCKKDKDGLELWVDHIRAEQTNTHTSGYVQRYPERANNYPISSKDKPSLKTKGLAPARTPPNMSVDEWLNTPLEALETAAEKKRREIAKATKLRRSEIKGKRVYEVHLMRKLDEKRLEHWLEQKSKKAVEDALYGYQLELI